MRTETIGSCTLICGDAREVLPTLGKVDAVVTSPPYNKGTQTGAFANMRNAYASYEDNLPDDEYVEWQKQLIRDCWNLTAPDGAIFYNHKPMIVEGAAQLPTRLVPHEATLRQIIIWDRKGGMNWGDGHFCPNHEWVLFIAHRQFRLKSRAESAFGDVWQLDIEQRRTAHPCPFPVELPRKIISATSADLILDPFMGSGTTGVACVKLGRRFIGIEIEPKYYEIAVRRIEQAYAQPDLFVSPPAPKPEQLSLLDAK